MKTVGELVVYGTSGVCKIEDLREESFSGTARMYYILRPMAEHGNSCIFVPADNEKLVGDMQAILQPQELYDAVRDIAPFSAQEWPVEGRTRSKLCRELLASGNREQMIRLIKTVLGSGKRPTASEETAAQRAASMLYQEFSLVLQIKKEDVISFVMGEKQPLPLV